MLREFAGTTEGSHEEEVHRPSDGRRAVQVPREDREAQRVESDGSARPGSVEGRCRQAGLDGPADRGRVLVPHQDCGEHSPAVRAGGVRAGAGTQAAAGAAGAQASRRGAGSQGSGAASGTAAEGLRALDAAPAGAPGGRTGDRGVRQLRDGQADAKKTASPSARSRTG